MYKNTNCKLQAHRGVSTDAPENTIAAFREAVKQGYDIIELDPKFTEDDVCVVLHDRTLNRTGRINGKEIEENLNVAEVTYDFLRRVDVGEWFSPLYSQERIPLLSEALEFACKNGIEIKIDNVVQTFSMQQREILYNIVARCGAEAGLTCSDLSVLKEFAEKFPTAPLHYDGEVNDEALNALDSFCRGHETTVWMRLDNSLTSWSKIPPVNIESAKKIKSRFKLGIWILSDDEQMKQALDFGADIVETTGGIKP